MNAADRSKLATNNEHRIQELENNATDELEHKINDLEWRIEEQLES